MIIFNTRSVARIKLQVPYRVQDALRMEFNRIGDVETSQNIQSLLYAPVLLHK